MVNAGRQLTRLKTISNEEENFGTEEEKVVFRANKIHIQVKLGNSTKFINLNTRVNAFLARKPKVHLQGGKVFRET